MRMQTTYPDHNYPIVVDHHIDLLKELRYYSHYIYIIDQSLKTAHQQRINRMMHPEGICFYVEAGEQLKTLHSYSEQIDAILACNITRDSVVIAIGGGTIGDFAGFIAATLLRGVDFVQVPTTILAHDSAIGGKVGINSQYGKNLIGAFKRPAGVYYDLGFLTTLPQAERLSGFGEIVKHAMLQGDHQLQQLMLDFPERSHLADIEKMEHWLIEGMKLKLSVVKADEYEAGRRKLLNLGHTFGHAVEFVHHIPHGHAVLIGLIYSSLLSGRPVTALKAWLAQLGLEMPVFQSFDIYLALMKKDKKNDKDIQFVLLGEEPYTTAVMVTQLEAAFRELTGGHDGN